MHYVITLLTVIKFSNYFSGYNHINEVFSNLLIRQLLVVPEGGRINKVPLYLKFVLLEDTNLQSTYLLSYFLHKRYTVHLSDQ